MLRAEQRDLAEEFAQAAASKRAPIAAHAASMQPMGQALAAGASKLNVEELRATVRSHLQRAQAGQQACAEEAADVIAGHRDKAPADEPLPQIAPGQGAPSPVAAKQRPLETKGKLKRPRSARHKMGADCKEHDMIEGQVATMQSAAQAMDAMAAFTGISGVDAVLDALPLAPLRQQQLDSLRSISAASDEFGRFLANDESANCAGRDVPVSRSYLALDAAAFTGTFESPYAAIGGVMGEMLQNLDRERAMLRSVSGVLDLVGDVLAVANLLAFVYRPIAVPVNMISRVVSMVGAGTAAMSTTMDLAMVALAAAKFNELKNGNNPAQTQAMAALLKKESLRGVQAMKSLGRTASKARMKADGGKVVLGKLRNRLGLGAPYVPLRTLRVGAQKAKNRRRQLGKRNAGKMKKRDKARLRAQREAARRDEDAMAQAADQQALKEAAQAKTQRRWSTLMKVEKDASKHQLQRAGPASSLGAAVVKLDRAAWHALPEETSEHTAAEVCALPDEVEWTPHALGTVQAANSKLAPIRRQIDTYIGRHKSLMLEFQDVGDTALALRTLDLDRQRLVEKNQIKMEESRGILSETGLAVQNAVPTMSQLALAQAEAANVAIGDASIPEVKGGSWWQRVLKFIRRKVRELAQATIGRVENWLSGQLLALITNTSQAQFHGILTGSAEAVRQGEAGIADANGATADAVAQSTALHSLASEEERTAFAQVLESRAAIADAVELRADVVAMEAALPLELSDGAAYVDALRAQVASGADGQD